MKERFVHRLRKKAKKGMRGWPPATIALYGPNLDRASKVVVSIIPSGHADVGEMRKWHLDAGDLRNNARITEEMLALMAAHGVLSVVMTDRIIGRRRKHWGGLADLDRSRCPPSQDALRSIS